MRLIIEAVLFFLVLGFTEAIIKPTAKQWVRRRVIKYAPMALGALDAQMPNLLKEYDGKQLEQVVRTKLESLTGETWSKEELDEVFRMYDPRITADKTASLAIQTFLETPIKFS
jgi:hypothetical protein